MITIGTVLVDGERARWVQHRRHSIYGSALDIRLPGAESGARPYDKGQLLQVCVFSAGCHAPLRLGRVFVLFAVALWQRPGAWLNVRYGCCHSGGHSVHQDRHTCDLYPGAIRFGRLCHEMTMVSDIGDCRSRQ